MKVTEIEYIPIKPKMGCRGFVSFVLEDSLYCGSVAVYSRPSGGIRLVWPTIKNNGVQYAVCHPISNNLSRIVEQSVEEKIDQIERRQIEAQTENYSPIAPPLI